MTWKCDMCGSTDNEFCDMTDYGIWEACIKCDKELEILIHNYIKKKNGEKSDKS